MRLPRMSRNSRSSLTAPTSAPSGTELHAGAPAAVTGRPADHQKSSVAPLTDARTPDGFNCAASAGWISAGSGSECAVAASAASDGNGRACEAGGNDERRRTQQANPIAASLLGRALVPDRRSRSIRLASSVRELTDKRRALVVGDLLPARTERGARPLLEPCDANLRVLGARERLEPLQRAAVRRMRHVGHHVD